MHPQTLTAENLTYHYRNGHGVEGLSFQVQPGEILTLLGPNGSGKSTLLRLLAGLYRPQAGCLTLFGAPTPPIPARLRRRLGVLFDTPAHFDDLTGAENASFFAVAYGLLPAEAAARLAVLADRFGIAAHLEDPVAEFSFGMRRKLALIEALLPSPDLLLLDEPGAGLDYAARLASEEVLKAHCERGASVVIATNDVAEAQALSQRVLFLHQGRMVACDTPAHLLARLSRGRRVTLRLAAPIPLDPLADIPTVQEVSALPDQEIVLLSWDGQRSVAEIVNTVHRQGGEITTLTVEAPTLGDVFLTLTGQPLEEG